MKFIAYLVIGMGYLIGFITLALLYMVWLLCRAIALLITVIEDRLGPREEVPSWPTT